MADCLTGEGRYAIKPWSRLDSIVRGAGSEPVGRPSLTKQPKRLMPSASRGCAPGGGLCRGGKLDIRYKDFEGDRPADRAHAPRGVLPFRRKIASRSAAIEYARSLPPHFEGSLLALFIDRDFNLLDLDRLGQGNAAECGLESTALVSRAAKLGAAGFVLIHHAPERLSGGSAGEYRVTREIRKAGEDYEIHLLDHLILVGDKLIDISL